MPGRFKNKVKAIIFDCDGTLVDSEESHLFAWREVIKDYGVSCTQEEEFSFFGKPDLAIAHMIFKKIGKDSVDLLLRKKIRYFAQFLKNGVLPIEGTVNFARLLHKEKDKHGLKLAVASAATKSEIFFNLKSVGLDNIFELVLSGQDDLFDYDDPEGVNKPKPYIYLHAAKILGVHPRQCVVIEDSVTGVTAGIQAGCITVAVPTSYSKYQDLSQATLKIDSLNNYSVADFLETISRHSFSTKKS